MPDQEKPPEEKQHSCGRCGWSGPNPTHVHFMDYEVLRCPRCWATLEVINDKENNEQAKQTEGSIGKEGPSI